jgi:hypothetical protein
MFNTFSDLDQRLQKRALGILDQMSASKTAIINRFSPNRSNYVSNCNFFNNESVGLPSLCDLLTSSVGKAAKGKHVLSIQDTSILNFMHHGGKLSIQDKHLGLVGTDRSAGFFCIQAW